MRNEFIRRILHEGIHAGNHRENHDFLAEPQY